MKYILSILIILSSLTAIGQGTPTYQGNTTSITYNRGTVGALRMQLLPRGFYPFPTFDTLGTIWVDSANTRGLYYHNGTSRIRMASIPYVDSVALSIEAGSVDSSIYSTVNRLYKITDSTFNIIDSNNTIIYSNIATLQSDVVTLDSALGVAFGAISELYDTLPNYVPYTGATTDVNLGTHNILPNSVRLSTSPTGTLTNVGQLYFDATNLTPAIPLNANVTLQIGQEEHIRARNNTGVQINDGQVVYVNDAQGNNPTIALANSDSVNTSIVVGVATENIAINGTGFVTTFGIVNGFNTSTFNDGDALYLNTVSGQLSNTIPAPPHNVVKVAIALNSTINGKIFVQPSEPLGQDTTFATPYNSDRVAPTQRSIGTYTRKIVRDTASALRNAINAKYGTSDTGRAATNIVTGGSLNKVRDSLAALSGGGGTPISASAYQMLYKSGGDTVRGTTRVRIDTTDLRMEFAYDSTTTTVTTDPHGGIKMWGSNRMGMGTVRINDTVSISAALQRAMNAQITSTILPVFPTIAYTNNFLYGGMMSTGGTVTYVAGAPSTIQHLNYNKALFATASGANSGSFLRVGSITQSSGIVGGNTKFSLGGGRGTFTFSFPTYLSTERIMVGYWSGATISGTFTGEPSTMLTNLAALFLVKESTDSTLFFVHQAAFSAPTRVNTGITPNNEDVYRLTVYVAPNSTYYMQLEILGRTGTRVITINPTTNIPAPLTRFVGYQGVNNGTVGGTVRYGFIQMMEEIY